MKHKNGNLQAGFTLIELMVVVVILGIIASIALPSYRDHVRKARRAAATTCVSAVAQRLERVYTTDLTYTTKPSDSVLTASCDPDALRYYNVSTSNVQAKAYTVSAAPTGAQRGDSCGTLSLNQAGGKSPATKGCW